MRFGLIILVFVALTGISADVPRGHLTSETRADLGSICKHYVNRARFMVRGDNQEFVATLADACTAARRSLDGAAIPERHAAISFLVRLRTFRDTVIDMNMTRVFGKEYTPVTRIRQGKGAKTEEMRRVSQTGEYLIAYRMGLLKAYRAWLDTAPQIALVSDKGPKP